uniref:Entry-fusion-complex G9/A16 n=1 Tax=Pithovirus LCPAC101 TaxID=2506586 RepID=A0A481Z4E7_9VIRU|nr:MAG: entry-fusion-complex G9/A16 [Pithovirus LCPAC101]
MTDITAFTIQKGVCNRFYASTDDLCTNDDGKQIGLVTSGACIQFVEPTCKECTKVCPEECVPLGSDVTADWKEGTGDENRTLACTYDASTFTLDDITKYMIEYGKDDNYNKVIMPDFCFKDSNICVENPNTGKPWKTCPNMLNDGAAGSMCRNWRSTNTELADEEQLGYCDDNSSNPTCACYNRDNDPIYKLLDPKLDINDGCWYKVCSQPQGYLVPSDLINTDPPCPCDDILCPQVNDAISNSISDLPVSAFKKALTCTVTSSPKPIPEKKSSNATIIIGIIIFIIIIFIIFGLIYYYNTTKITKKYVPGSISVAPAAVASTSTPSPQAQNIGRIYRRV